MAPDRLRSIVPMFGGGTRYVETLDAVLEFVEAHQPTIDELVGWHRGSFSNVTSRDSIMRRVSYLRQVGFLQQADERWRIGDAGWESVQQGDVGTLLWIMCDRNVGLRSLLYALSAGPMTLEEVSEQQLDTHPELGWSRGETDMARQRVNWLRSMGLVKERGDAYVLTGEGRSFVEDAVAEWSDSEWTPAMTDDGMSAGTCATTIHAREVDPEFRATVILRHDGEFPVSGVDRPGLLDIAHMLARNEFPEYRADLANVLPLSKTHHAAFDRGVFTIDRDYRLQVNPSFETQSELLQRTIIEQDGERIPMADESLNPEYLAQHNAELAWV
ncbi:HNH endonuclease [Natronobacterium texcoconense]|uniref:Putative restriction endonuclease n=1 Tax=Natronobacterium texcoconense TaxID=1095778 RepID=A0A1H1FXV7_NATTX|nr:HNH endonuclease [Natronobacterium texcoconense]SDR05773.1 putative restriction endonuclease [Natronobacterium texcoconense]